MKDATIPYKANLDGSAAIIEGLVDEGGITAIAGARVLSPDNSNLGKVRTTDLKGRSVQSKAAHGVYYPKKVK